MLETLVSQLLDPFRIGLVLFLFLTALRTRAAMGLATPLAVGVLFVAVLLPLTTGANAATDNAGKLTAMACGIVSNAIILGCFISAWAVWTRVRQ